MMSRPMCSGVPGSRSSRGHGPSRRNLDEFDLVLPLVAWGYHLDPPRWHALLDRLERERTEDSESGAAAPLEQRQALSGRAWGRTAWRSSRPGWLSRSTRRRLTRARAEYGDELVIKPPVSAAADGTHLLQPNDPLPQASRGRAMMIQPFLPSVAAEGEYSIMLFGGHFSHAIVKRPKAGDYRVQPHLGGTEEPCAPPPGAIELAKAALAAAPAEAAYARVDMVRDLSGELAIIELELIEPSLWLQHAPDGGASFARVIMDARV